MTGAVRSWIPALGLILALLTCGCVSHLPLRTTPVGVEGPAQGRACVGPARASRSGSCLEIRPSGALLGFVEFDDLGWYWNPEQAATVLTRIRAELRDSPAVLVVFAHGWNHDAGAGDNNANDFGTTLDALVQSEHQRTLRGPGDRHRAIIGIFLGWRGNAYTNARSEESPLQSVTWLYRWSSFWSRKATAHRVGSEQMVAFLSDLEDLWKERMVADRTLGSQLPSRLLSVGHSFGGAVLYSALSKVLVDRRPAGDSEPTTATYGDGVVLVNPAFESSLFEPLLAFGRRGGGSRTPERRQSEFHPLVSVFASGADRPNRVLFPVGRRLSTATKRYRLQSGGETMTGSRSFQKKANLSALGHFVPITSHVLCPADLARSKSSFCKDQATVHDLAGPDHSSAAHPPSSRSPSEAVAEIRTQLAQQVHQPRWRQRFEPGVLLIHATDKLDPASPYLVVRVDGSIIKDHNDIFGADFLSFLIQYLATFEGE